MVFLQTRNPLDGSISLTPLTDPVAAKPDTRQMQIKAPVPLAVGTEYVAKVCGQTQPLPTPDLAASLPATPSAAPIYQAATCLTRLCATVLALLARVAGDSAFRCTPQAALTVLPLCFAGDSYKRRRLERYCTIYGCYYRPNRVGTCACR